MSLTVVEAEIHNLLIILHELSCLGQCRWVINHNFVVTVGVDELLATEDPASSVNRSNCVVWFNGIHQIRILGVLLLLFFRLLLLDLGIFLGCFLALKILGFLLLNQFFLGSLHSQQSIKTIKVIGSLFLGFLVLLLFLFFVLVLSRFLFLFVRQDLHGEMCKFLNFPYLLPLILFVTLPELVLFIIILLPSVTFTVHILVFGLYLIENRPLIGYVARISSPLS